MKCSHSSCLLLVSVCESVHAFYIVCLVMVKKKSMQSAEKGRDLQGVIGKRQLVPNG